jgi:SAM-dependent methyltransferase/ribosomal protein S18 acetylase RimI-like enzyme
MIRRMEARDAKTISKIHIDALGIGFLSTLGEGFLKTLYEGIARSRFGIGYVYVEDSQIIGFITGCEDVSKLLKEIYRKKLLKFGKTIFLKALRKPGIIRSIYQSFRYPDLTQTKVKAELLSIAVMEVYRDKGIGKELVEALIKHFKGIGISRFKVSVDQRLLGADEFYKALGFKLIGSMEIYNKKLDIYLYELDGIKGTGSSHSYENMTKIKFFDSRDWDRYWADEMGEGSGAQKIVSRFRKHFDDEYVKQLRKLSSATDEKILEVGCGTGYSSHKLADIGNNVFALDYSPQAKNFWSKKLANFLVADGFHIPLKSNSFDLVWNAGVLEHFSNPQDMLREMIRVCKPNGTVCVFVPYIFDITAHLKLYGEENIFTKKKLKNELRELEDVGIKVLYKCGGMIICGWGRKKGKGD